MQTLKRFYTDQEISTNGVIELNEEESSHISKTLRMNIADEVEIFNNNQSALAKIIRLGKLVQVQVVELRDSVSSKSSYQHFYVGIIRSKNLDLLIEKISELGVDEFTPVICEYSQYNEISENRLDRWRKISIAAAKQSERKSILKINPPISFKDAITASGINLMLVSREQEDVESVQTFFEKNRDLSKVKSFIGPEGGFSNNEIKLAKEQNFHLINFNKNILRTETAAIAWAGILGSRLLN
jgi:16S rRNA (uracil1498-N3)-methyltransferase